MKKVFFAIAAVLLLISCSGDDNNNSQQTPINPNGTLLTKIVVSGSGLGYVAELEYSGNYLVKQTSGTPGTYDTYTYTGNLITGITHYSDNSVFSTEFFAYDSQERLIVRMILSGTSDGASRVTYVYDDADDTVMVTTYIGDTNQQNTLYRKMKVYLEDGLPVKTERFDISDNSIDQIQTFAYDDKNSPYNGIVGYQKLTWYDNNLIAPHNYLTMTSTFPPSTSVDTDTVSYNYNLSDFPTQATFDNDGTVLVFQYFYQ
ncbi:hypothetical protein [Flavobacterium sp.]|uniref:hypothetical protein n=1 Tax=Flavobacterium sp. TaxID=239 RepID=UPI0039E22CE9